MLSDLACCMTGMTSVHSPQDAAAGWPSWLDLPAGSQRPSCVSSWFVDAMPARPDARPTFSMLPWHSEADQLLGVRMHKVSRLLLQLP